MQKYTNLFSLRNLEKQNEKNWWTNEVVPDVKLNLATSRGKFGFYRRKVTLILRVAKLWSCKASKYLSLRGVKGRSNLIIGS